MSAELPAIILAGGFGTRLASVVSDRPKPMADIAGKPFLERLLNRLIAQGVTRAVLAVGYKREVIQAHFGNEYRGLPIAYSEEIEPLGTGGAMRKAFDEQKLDFALVLNGDTFCTVELPVLVKTHRHSGAAATLVLLDVDDAGRYGAVELGSDGRISAFREKNPQPAPGLINAGVYALERRVFDLAPADTKFSFETEVLQKSAATARFAGHVTKATFIDIGVPDDYHRAQTLLADA
jgi:D-glycero-alpha-D-manno-heptose 1-phosphate guanylyltransferase